MREECRQAVEAAIGRMISEAEARNIEQRIRETMRRLAVDDPQAWGALSLDQRLERAATAAGEQLVSEAHLKRARIARTVAAHDRIMAYTEAQVAHGEDQTRLDAVERMLAPKNDGKNHIQSVESQTNGLVAYSMGRLVDAWEAISPRFLGLFRNKAAEEAMILELHGTPTGRPGMAKAAQTFHDLAEELRLRYVDAGGQVGKLDNWGMPHAWSQRYFLKAGRDAVVEDFMRWIDRSRYVHEDGRLFSDPEMRDFLGNAWLTVATDGANQQGNVEHLGGRIKANRHAAHRQIHFTDGQAALEATRRYSDRNLFQTLAGHVRAMARDIALVETFGPNADLAIRHHLDQFYREAAVATPGREGRYAAQAERITNLYNYVAGNLPPPAHHGLANAAQDVRNVLSAALLGSASITAITDEGTVYLTAKVNHLPLHQVFLNEVRAFNLFDRTEKRLAMRAGLLVDTMIDEVNRFAADRAGPRFSSKLSTAFIRLSGLSGMTEARRRAFSVTMMDTIGHLTRQVETLEALDPGDHRILLSKGLTDADWQIWRAAQPEAWRGNDTVLTAEAIMRVPDDTVRAIDSSLSPSLAKQRAATKLLGLVLEEQDLAVIDPGARERAAMTAGTRRGTLKGELVRSFFLFKSFPFALIKRHWERGLTLYDGIPGKAGYLATLISLQTILGALALEINDVVSGRDPRGLTPDDARWKRAWMAAFLKGGALGLYGDFLFNETTSGNRSLIATASGPVGGLIESTDDLLRGNIIQAMRGEDTHAGAEAVRFAKGLTPGGNLWYAKAAMDHLIFQELQEYLSPGYLARQQARARRLYGTSYWWAPGDPLSEARAPNLERVVTDR
jgi:hypothetical protein